MNPLANNIYSLGTVGYLNKDKNRALILEVTLLGIKIYFNPYSVIRYLLIIRGMARYYRSQKKILNESIDMHIKLKVLLFFYIQSSQVFLSTLYIRSIICSL